MASTDDDPCRQLLELFVYAPIGLMVEAKRMYPGVIDAGRQRVDNQIRLARLVGEFAVRQGRQLVERRLQEFARPSIDDDANRRLDPPSAASVDRTGAGFDSADRGLTMSVPAPDTGPGSSPVIPPPEMSVPPVDAGSLAITGYDTLAASQIVDCLDGLPDEDLERIGRYEAAHRGRRTVLGQVARLRGSVS